MSSESQPFLEKCAVELPDVDDDEPERCATPKRRGRLSSAGVWWIHAVAFVLYTVAFVFLARQSGPKCNPNLHPLDDLDIRYRTATYTDFEESVYAGPPSPELDQAWHELMAGMALRIDDDEMKASNQSSVSLPTGGGNMAWLGVHHELHCIKMVRQWNYKKHYHPEFHDEGLLTHWDVHVDHCLDLLRSAAMCRADTTLTTFGWSTQEQPMLNTRLLPRRCVDWEALTESVRHRMVDKEEISALINPKLHPEAAAG